MPTNSPTAELAQGSPETQVIELENLSDIFAIPQSSDVYYCWMPEVEQGDKPYLAYWSLARGNWEWWHCTAHTVVQREPLTLRASIGWVDKHGWITDGKWSDA